MDRYLQTARFLPRYETVTRCVKSGRFGFNPVKVKVQFITCREGPDGEWRYNSTLSLTSALDGVGWLTPRPGRFIPGIGISAYCIIGWVGPGPVWTGAENLARTGIRSQYRPVAIPTELSRPCEE